MAPCYANDLFKPKGVGMENSSEVERSLGYLRWLLIAWFVIQTLEGATFVAGHYHLPYAVGIPLGIALIAVILTSLYRSIREGSAAARLILTALAVVQIIGLVVGIMRNVSLIANDALALAEMSIRVAVIVFVNTVPIKSITPVASASQPHPG
jgi:hypothetical protein